MPGDRLLPGELRLVLDAVRWIRPQAIHALIPEETCDIGGLGAVAAQESVVAESVQLTRADRRLRRDVRDIVGVDEP
jgi:hypothetical protein